MSKKIIFLRFSIFLILISFCALSFANAYKTDLMKVRVGFFEFDGYHQIEEDGTKSGYGYEFLQMIAPYANFEYEYIGYNKSWDDMQTMLLNGEIDLLTSAQKTSSREELFDYSDRNIGFSSTILATLPTNAKLSTADFSSFEGINVGMIPNNSRNNSFRAYSEKHSFNYNEVYFHDQKEMENALHRGEIDAMVTSDLRILENEVVVAKFDDSPFFAIVKKGNSEVLNRVNLAIELLSSDIPSWVHTLFYKYYNNVYRGNEIMLLPDEEEYFSNLATKNQKLKVIINPDRAPYSYYEKKKFQGIFVDVLEDISKRLGFDYELIECTTVGEYETTIRAGIPDIVFGSVMDTSTAEEMGYSMTNTFHTTSLSCITRVKEPKTLSRVAVNDGMSILNKRYNRLYGNREQVKCKTIKECVEAVRTHRADCTYTYTYTAAKFVFEDVHSSLAYTPVSDTLTNIGIAVNHKEDPVLFHLMNRIAGNLSEDELQTYITKHTHFNYAENIFTYLVYRQPITLVIILMAISITIMLTSVFRRNRQRKFDLLLLKEAQEKRNAMELAYQAAEKANKAKSDFLSKMSHDIRTPMNAIVGLTAIAQTHINEPDKMNDYLSKITTSSKHLLGLINDVLDMSKIESGTFSLSYNEFSISGLVNQLVEIVMPEVRAHKHKLKIHAENLKHDNVVGDSLHIQQVFVNIIGNSIKYTPDGGKIDIYIKELESQKSKIGEFEFVFKDNGIGMSKEFLEKVFEPFTREQDSRVNKIQGTGLGLAITKNIITLMDGTINIDSEQEKGTTTTIVLKLKLSENDILINIDSEKDEIVEESPLGGIEKFDYSGKRALLVDDNAINREIAHEILNTTGIQIDEAEDGQAAVNKFIASEENYYDIIFMDVQMPVMNGYTATTTIRGQARSDASTIPIIALTADAFTEDVERATRAGMNGHLAKPLDIKKLSSVMTKWITK